MAKRVPIEERIVEWFENAGGPERRLMLAIIRRIVRMQEGDVPSRKARKPKGATVPADSQIRGQQ